MNIIYISGLNHKQIQTLIYTERCIHKPFPVSLPHRIHAETALKIAGKTQVGGRVLCLCKGNTSSRHSFAKGKQTTAQHIHSVLQNVFAHDFSLLFSCSFVYSFRPVPSFFTLSLMSSSPSIFIFTVFLSFFLSFIFHFFFYAFFFLTFFVRSVFLAFVCLFSPFPFSLSLFSFFLLYFQSVYSFSLINAYCFPLFLFCFFLCSFFF
ncbi:unnamed protein product [Acanthosepion pharaonis]|uniref:Uncharacterized protein n=1 Tax=Acanthosepion pharaonis TaxID=158019 RepID=A0A812B343_ACAPH|nr:unnamed protein product [Sepia pharaonis]